MVLTIYTGLGVFNLTGLIIFEGFELLFYVGLKIKFTFTVQVLNSQILLINSISFHEAVPLACLFPENNP